MRRRLENLARPFACNWGGEITQGLGAGADPDVGRQSAEEDIERIKEVIGGSDMLFIAAGMGGGTGTGAAPVVARIAKEMGILTVAVVTRPFMFEGKIRQKVAAAGIAELSQYVDSLITIPNEKLLTVLGKNMAVSSAFKEVNNVLSGAVQGITELITRPGLINVDFADVRTVMSEMGTAMMGSGTASGENRARQAAEAAINNPLLEDVNLSGARGILVNITAGLNLSVGELEEVGEAVKHFTADTATVVVGAVIDSDMEDELRVTVVATGLGQVSAQTGIPHAALNDNLRADGSVNYQRLDQPTMMRRQGANAPAGATNPGDTTQEMEYLDIPAFLRRSEEEPTS